MKTCFRVGLAESVSLTGNEKLLDTGKDFWADTPTLQMPKPWV
jgi:hypothetical protein